MLFGYDLAFKPELFEIETGGKGKRFQFVYGDIFESLVHLEDIKAIHIGELEIPVEVK